MFINVSFTKVFRPLTAINCYYPVVISIWVSRKAQYLPDNTNHVTLCLSNVDVCLLWRWLCTPTMSLIVYSWVHLRSNWNEIHYTTCANRKGVRMSSQSTGRVYVSDAGYWNTANHPAISDQSVLHCSRFALHCTSWAPLLRLNVRLYVPVNMFITLIVRPSNTVWKCIYSLSSCIKVTPEAG